MNSSPHWFSVVVVAHEAHGVPLDDLVRAVAAGAVGDAVEDADGA